MACGDNRGHLFFFPFVEEVRVGSAIASVGFDAEFLLRQSIRHPGGNLQALTGILSFPEADFSELIRVSGPALGTASPRSSERRRRAPVLFLPPLLVVFLVFLRYLLTCNALDVGSG